MGPCPARRARRCRPACLAALALTLAAGLAGGVPASAQARAEPPPNLSPLWQKAVETYRANRHWYPERAVITSEVLNGQMKFRSFTEIFLTLRPNDRGWLSVQMDRYLRNGVDETDRMRSRIRIRSPLSTMAPSEENGYSISIAESPFDPDDQRNVSVTPCDEKRVLAGRVCRRFDFLYRHEGLEGDEDDATVWRGAAWLDEKSGRPVELAFSVTPLPGRLRRAEIVYRYETEWPDRWVVKDAVIRGSGGFLFIKRHFTVTTIFSQYARWPRDLAPGGPSPR